MANQAHEVVIVGGGVVGMSVAYYLGQAGVRSVIVERDAVGSHASGFAYGGLSPLSGVGIPGVLAEMAQEGSRLHQDLAEALATEAGMDVEFRKRASLVLALSEADARRLRAILPWQQQQAGYRVRWLDAGEARSVEARISPDTQGATLVEGTADVEPYRLVLALTRAVETMGGSVRHGRVIGLRREGSRVTGVVLEHGELRGGAVVLALGPWSGEVSTWVGLSIAVRPLKGQILRLKASGPSVACSVGWGHNYATTKLDGLLWAGTTEEEVGFDEESTPAARDLIGAALLAMLPAMEDAEVVYQTACLRPVTADGLPLLGRVPGLDGVYVATGGGRKGILLGPPMGQVIADLITTGKPKLTIEPFSPGRFAAT